MKRLIVFALASLLIAGCGKNEATEKTNTPEIVISDSEKTKEEAEEVISVEDTEEANDGNQEKGNDGENGTLTEASLYHGSTDGEFDGVMAEGVGSGIIFSTEKKEREDKDDNGKSYYIAEYEIPKIEIVGKTAAESAINDYLMQSAESYETNMDIMSAESLAMNETEGDLREEVEDSDMAAIVYSDYNSFSPARLDDKVISIREEASVFTGGAHPMHAITGFNFDANTGNLLTLASICADTGNLKKVAKEYIVSACENDPEIKEGLFEGYEEQIDSIFAEGNWYMTNNGVVFVAGEYLLAPYAAGILEFEVPYSMIDSLNSAYIR